MKRLNNAFDNLCYSTQIFKQKDYFCLNKEFEFEIDLDEMMYSTGLIKNIRNDIKKYLTHFNWVIIDQLTFSFDWMLSQEIYYDYSFRLLDIQKIIIDSFSGINGILIDDCQVESISSRIFIVNLPKLFIKLDVYNACILYKKELKFIPKCGHENVYTPIGFDKNNIEHLNSIYLFCLKGIRLDLIYSLDEERKKENGLVFYPPVFGYHISRIGEYSKKILEFTELKKCLTKQCQIPKDGFGIPQILCLLS